MCTKLFAILIVFASTSLANAESAQIVKRFHLYNQTGSTVKIVYTPKSRHGGMFRINTFLAVTRGNGQNGLLCPNIVYTDRNGSANPSAPFPCASTADATNNTEQTIPVPNVGGNSIIVTVSTSGDVSGAKYDVTIIVEKF